MIYIMIQLLMMNYMTTIFTNAIPMSIFNLIKTKFTYMNYINLTKKG